MVPRILRQRRRLRACVMALALLGAAGVTVIGQHASTASAAGPAVGLPRGIPPGGIPRSVLSVIPRRLYDPIGADGATQHELLAVAAEISAAASPSAYAGEALNTRAGLVELYLAGPRMHGPGGAVRPLSRWQRSLVRVHWVPRSARQLARFMSLTSGIAGRLRTAGIDVQSWWPDFLDGVVAVTLREASATQIRATRRALNGIPVLVTSTASPAPVPASAAAAAQEPTCPPSGGGENSACDQFPWNGGDFITDPQGTCTDSWPVMMGGSPYLLTAGHCDVKTGGGDQFSNGGQDGSAPIGNVPGALPVLGVNSNNLLTTSQHIDSQLIGTGSGSGALMATPDVWSGSTLGNVASSTALPVLGATTPPVGTLVCDDGAYEGLVCGADVVSDGYGGCQVSAVGGTNYSFCDTYKAVLVTGSPYGLLMGEGDSGGPDFEMSSSGVTAIGLNSLADAGMPCAQYTGRSDQANGLGFDVCSKDMYFTGIQSILAAEKATLIPPLVNASGGGQFLSEWVATVRGNSMNIGEPAAAWSAISGGQAQRFQGGWIYWSQAAGTHEIQGDINSDYQSLGATGSAVGFPASDEQNAPGGGRENLFNGTTCAAGTLTGQGGVILWRSATGAHEMQGCIYQAYLQNYGGPGGALGYPTTDESSMAGGRYNHMSGTSCGSASGSGIYWNGVAHEVYGCIYQKYESIGEANSGLGFPVSDEYAYNGGRRQDFQGGNIIYTTSTGAVVTFNGTLCTDYGGSTMTGPNACTGFHTAPPAGKPASGNVWFSGGGVGLHGQEIWTYGNGTTATSTAIYNLTGLSTAHVMQLQAYIPNNHADATSAHYHYCSPGGGCADGYINQAKYGNVWIAFGSVCTTDGTATIVLADDGGDNYPAEIGADAIRAVLTTLAC